MGQAGRYRVSILPSLFCSRHFRSATAYPPIYWTRKTIPSIDEAPITPQTDSLSEHPTHTLEHTVLFWVVRVVFAGNLQHGRKRVREGIDTRPDSFGDLASSTVSISIRHIYSTYWTGKTRPTHMLVDQNDRNVLSLLGEVLECFFDSWRFGLGIND